MILIALFFVFGSSPRMRGCFCSLAAHFLLLTVFPAHAGVFPKSQPSMPAMAGLPRACGGVSLGHCGVYIFLMSSPRMRGCFYDMTSLHDPPIVFPAHAGVFPGYEPAPLTYISLPRACGGVSFYRSFNADFLESSPRMRGCFLTVEEGLSLWGVFPAHAGVFLKTGPAFPLTRGLPRACGGVS